MLGPRVCPFRIWRRRRGDRRVRGRPSDESARRSSVSMTLIDDVLADLEAPTRADDPDAERWRRAQLLLAAIDGDRARLFELQSLFILRLHRASDDFGASE